MKIWEGRTILAPEKAIAWMFDMQEDDHGPAKHAGDGVKLGPGEGRRILNRTPARVEVEDRWGRGRFVQRSVVTLVDPLTIGYDGHGGGVHGTGTLRASRDSGSTILVYEGSACPETFLARILLPLLGPAFRKRTSKDMDNHVRDMEDDWARQPW
ncbi:MAG: hypothetical protein ACYDDF_03260 [Thermoplasmatota archaeon]